MKKLLFLIAIFCALKANAQNYLISFTGSGAATTVSTVKVENLTKATSLTLNGSDILRLTVTTGISQVDYEKSSGMKIYPNPMNDNSTVEIYPPVAGDVIITVYDMTGKLVTQINSYLENFRQEFRLSGVKNGFYLINVKGSTYQYSGKLLSNAKSTGTISIEKISNNQAVDAKTEKKGYKGTLATVDMAYTTGDRLKFTGISGNYSNVLMDIPTQSRTITFTFIACTDGDNNNYPVVSIGTQIWMAENLKTTKYKDGITVIPTKTNNTEWSNLTTPGYCWYNNDEANYKATYGALYNWYTVSTGNLCPTGWHMPSDAEWATLITYLGGTSVTGGKFKETGTTHWRSPNMGATNETGFTALPGGYRYTDGTFINIGFYTNWWSATESDAANAWDRDLLYDYSTVNRSNASKVYGFSVRCLKD